MTTDTDCIALTLIHQLFKDYQKPKDILGENGLAGCSLSTDKAK
jgi:hypothetical protein